MDFQGAFWRRPAAYLDPGVRARISGFARAPRESYEDGLSRLAADLSDGTWERENAGLLKRESVDLGFRIVIADRSRR